MKNRKSECPHSDSEHMWSVVGETFADHDEDGRLRWVTEEFVTYRCFVCGEEFVNIEFVDEEGIRLNDG